jgi:para-aminobenzoate synthetase component I
LAGQLHGHDGFVFLDSALAQPGALSLVAVEPDKILGGSADDWHLLERELADRSRPPGHLPGSEGAAVGWLGYDGTFCFAFYEKPWVFAHDGKWDKTPVPRDVPPSTMRPDFKALTTRDEYISRVETAMAYIAAGDIYQVCIAYPFEARFTGDPFPYYLALRSVSPAPYSAFININGTRIASASPELFLAMDGRAITTRPIKGTRPRHPDVRADRASSHELRASPKEAAELIMITDLERNDLGRVCEYGSVEVSGLLQMESFAQVHHLVSTVTGRLREDVSHARALFSCSPGGSISGAPKIRAMEIIRELEPHPRGIYTGAIGFFGFGGSSRFSIAIRTAIFQNTTARFSVGAGIVADSDPASEWLETGHKAAGLLAASKFRR